MQPEVLFFLLIGFFVTQGKLSELILLPDAARKDGAVCLDGSPPGFFYREGVGKGANNMIIHFEGGGWCVDENDCLKRSRTVLGSSKYWYSSYDLSIGFLSDNKEVNPDFYDWNVAFVNYCDGLSFTGNLDKAVMVDGHPIYFRGFRILNAVIEYLLEEKGMKHADNVIMTGCSAGGLTTYYDLDYVRTLLPTSIHLVGLSDAGYFIDAPNIEGKYVWRPLTQYAYKMHNSTFGEDNKCLENYHGDDTWKCLQAQYVYPFISTPIFAFNSQYDTWQLENILQVGCTPPNCTDQQMKAIQDYRDDFLKIANPLVQSKATGVFLDSCLVHCQSLDDKHWAEVNVEGQSARETFANWYFKQTGEIKKVDCKYPCNTSC